MGFFTLYLLGTAACSFLPRRFCYWIACRAADLYGSFAKKDRESVRNNLAIILGSEGVPSRQVREVFRNFAMYLVDFFRFGRLTREKLEKMVRFEGLERMVQARAGGKGVVGVTAHLGNYELAAAALTLQGIPVDGVLLSHQNERVDAFFTRQRERVGVRGLPIQKMDKREFVEKALAALRQNHVLGLVGDQDFFDHGIEVTLFGRSCKVPTGAASFAWRTGAPILPCFLVREPDGMQRFLVDQLITVPKNLPREEAIHQTTRQLAEVFARTIRRYPTQWYHFHPEFWRSVPAVIR